MNERPATRFDLRVFAVLQAAFVPLLAWVMLAKPDALPAWWTWLVVAVGVVGVIGLVRPSFVARYRSVWMTLLFPVQWVISRLLLAVVFFCVVTPIGLLLRVRRKPPAAGWHRQTGESMIDRMWKMW